MSLASNQGKSPCVGLKLFGLLATASDAPGQTALREPEQEKVPVTLCGGSLRHARAGIEVDDALEGSGDVDIPAPAQDKAPPIGSIAPSNSTGPDEVPLRVELRDEQVAGA